MKSQVSSFRLEFSGICCQEFPLRKLQCSEYTYHAAMGALGSSRQWAQVLGLVETMVAGRIALDKGMQESAARSAAMGR